MPHCSLWHPRAWNFSVLSDSLHQFPSMSLPFRHLLALSPPLHFSCSTITLLGPSQFCDSPSPVNLFLLPHCLPDADSSLLHTVLPWLSACLLPSVLSSFPPSLPLLCFIPLQALILKLFHKNTQCIRRVWPEQNFFAFLCPAYVLCVVWNVSHIPPCLWNLSSFLKTLPPPVALGV